MLFIKTSCHDVTQVFAKQAMKNSAEERGIR
jgi:hypothetical protein